LGSDAQVLPEIEVFSGTTGVETSVDPNQIDLGFPTDIFVDNPFPIAFTETSQQPNFDLLTVEGNLVLLPPTSVCATTGFLQGQIAGDAFPSASVSDPVYIRVELSLNNLLCETLVDPNDPQKPPIHLALAQDGNSFRPITANRDALSIVRWIEGEPAFWLAITQPTTEWGLGNGNPEDSRFFWEFGVSGTDSSATFSERFLEKQANLPANTSDLLDLTPVDTFLRVNLQPDSFNLSQPVLWAEFDSFQGTTNVASASDHTQIDPGSSLGISAFALIGFYDQSQSVPEEGIHISSVLRDLDPELGCQAAGNFTMQLNTDAFAQASPQNPIYIQLSLQNNVTLCDTRVGPGSDTPLLLALSLDSDFQGDQLIADPESVAIVRWVAGEQSIWLRITTPSSTWIRTITDALIAPSENRRVSWSLGFTPSVSFDLNSDNFNLGIANLPANSYNPLASTLADAADTTVGVDLAEANMTPSLSGWNGLLPNEPRTWTLSQGVETSVDPVDIVPGVPFDLVFYGLRDIAKSELAIPEKTVLIRGVNDLTLRAIPALDVELQDVTWTNPTTGEFRSGRSIVWEPLPDDPRARTSVRAQVNDRFGRLDQFEVLILSYPDGVDLNGNGSNDICDLYLAAQNWPNTHSVLELTTVRVDTLSCESSNGTTE
jgi:hypothetical protein